jgi:hypothetical protein
MSNYKEISVCTLKGNLVISGDSSFFLVLFQILKCNENGEPLPIQTADSDYFKKLMIIGSEFKQKIKESYKAIQFLESIPENTKFLIVLGNVNADSSLNNYLSISRKIHKINNIKFPINGNKIDIFYTIFSFGDKKNKLFIGEYDKNKRICRFCGNSIPKVSFKKKAHAISESLGNKLLFCNEECDDCNIKFSQIEQDLFNLHHVLFSLYQIKGKEQIPSFKGKNLDIDNKNHKDEILFKLIDKNLSFNNIDGFKFELNEQNLKYSYQNIYKCFCKYALSFIDNIHLNRFRKTIEWIGSNKTEIDLPKIWMKQINHLYKQPLIAINIRQKTSDTDLPEFIFKLFILNIEYLFVAPFVDGSKFTFSESTKSKLTEIFELEKYDEVDFSSNEKSFLPISIEIKRQEGTEVVRIKKSEYENLTEEDRVKKYQKFRYLKLLMI